MTEERYTDYDEVCAQVIDYLNNYFNENDYIALTKFSPVDDEHQLIFALAKVLCSITGRDLFIDLPLLKYWKMKKECHYLRRDKKEKNLPIADIINFLYKELGDKFPHGFGEIYQVYYSGKEIL